MICPKCGESLPAVSDAYCPYCRAALDAPDDELSPVSGAADAQPSLGENDPDPAQQPIRITSWFLRELSNVFRSRDQILHDVYLESLAASGESVSSDWSLDELREDFFRLSCGNSSPGLSQTEEQEKRIVLITRCLNLWLLFWMMILPTISSLFIGLYFDGPNPFQRILLILFIWVILFPVSSLAGLMIQQLFGRPFTALLNRMLEPPQ